MRMAMLLLLLGMVLAGCQPGQGASPTPGSRVTVAGKVTIIGNEPFTAVALTTPENVVYELTGARAEELRPLQGTAMEVEGILVGRGRYAAQAVEVRGYRRLP